MLMDVLGGSVWEVAGSVAVDVGAGAAIGNEPFFTILRVRTTWVKVSMHRRGV
jgi:hypothetical protein